MSTNVMIKVKYVSEGHRVGLVRGEIYDAVISEDNDQIFIVADAYGDEYGYPASEFEILCGC